MCEQNKGFVCEICGEPDMVASKIIIEANYGAANDGDRVTLDVCGNCIDRLFEAIQKNE